MLKLYADRAYLPADSPPFALLFPFWGAPPADPRDASTARYDRWLEEAAGHVELVPLDEADLAVFPADWAVTEAGAADAPALAAELAQRARAAGKPLVVFYWSDSTAPVPVDGAVVLRTSLRRSRRAANERAMPALADDFVRDYLGGELHVRPRREVPVVGFCGFDPPRLRRGERLARRLLRLPTRSPRGRALAALARSTAVGANVVLRDAFFGGALRPDGTIDYAVQGRARREYVQNIVESDYVLAVRGAGNFSYRLYEAMSCGRIPVFVDTDSVLPFEREIDWRRLTVWVEERDVERVGEAVRAFHDALAPAEFEALQRECRRVWERYLSPEGFFAHLDLAVAP